MTGPAASGPAASGPAASGPAASGPTASGPTASSPTASSAADSGHQAAPTAVRRLLPPGPPIDPYRLAGPDGMVFDTGRRVLVGIGQALVVTLEGGLEGASLETARRVLADIRCDDHTGLPGSGVLAFGALPFARTRASSLVVPEVTYGREPDGIEWVTVVGRRSGDDPRGELLAHQGGDPGSTDPTSGPFADVEPLAPDDRFREMVSDAVGRIDRGELAKVVLSRQVEVRLSSAPDLPTLLERWRRLEPNCTVFSLPTPEGRFVGASPELLVARRGDRVVCRPLAGTTAQGSEATDTAFQRSAKDTHEHRLVVEAIGGALAPLCSSLEVPDGPELVHLHSVVHFGTTIEGVLRPRPDGTVPSALELVGALHPTPAVGGVPSAAALAVIAELESEPRGSYAGPVGTLDAHGDGEWVVGIRAATLNGDTARLVAGVGIVDGSEPGSELAETELKLSAVLDAIAPGGRRVASPSPAGA